VFRVVVATKRVLMASPPDGHWFSD
jgi:hypothetical protein